MNPLDIAYWTLGLSFMVISIIFVFKPDEPEP